MRYAFTFILCLALLSNVGAEPVTPINNGKLQSALNANGQRITGLPSPSSDNDPARLVDLALKAPINNASFTGTFAAPAGTITSSMIGDGTIVNADISNSAAIALSKLAVTGNISTTGTLTGASLTATSHLTIPLFGTPIQGREIAIASTGRTIVYTETGSTTLHTVADLSEPQTFSGKVINGASNTLTVRLANDVSGTLPVANGGTGQSTYSSGQILIGSSVGGSLVKGTITEGNNIQVTNGFGTITIGVTGTIPVANGGTGQTSLAAAITALLPNQAGHSGGVLTTNGAGALSWGTGGGGGSTISTPHVIWVQTGGDDSTGDGTMAKPYATATAGYNAGIATSTYFVLRLGVGAFNLTLSAPWSSYCVTIVGEGNALVMAGLPTYLAITATGAPATDANAGDGYGVFFTAHNCTIAVNTNGGNVTATDGGHYYAGNGGSVTIDGTASVSIDASGGGDSGSSNGIAEAGAGGNITLKGHLQVPTSGVLLSMSPEAYSTNSNHGGNLVLTGVDASRGAWISVSAGTGGSAGNIAAGNCAFFTGAPAVDSDHGGNSWSW